MITPTILNALARDRYHPGRGALTAKQKRSSFRLHPGVSAEVPDYGPFHREKSPTQTDQDAQDQKRSGEIWGTTPTNKGFTPTVEAYPGPLGASERGINFVTPIEPHPGSAPNHAKWYLGSTPGVMARLKNGIDYAAIPADVEVLQP